ncbi:MAG: DNA-binding domain-containing protein [Pseudomonadota bacterium]
MPTLDQAQAAFSEALLDASLAAPGDVKRPFAAGTDGSQTKRFDVYRNNVTVTAIEALGDTFPAVRTLVGEAFFSGAARIYFQQTPMRSPLLFQYGSTFGDFLDGFAPARSVPYLGDVARLEFNRLQAYHAADAAAVPITALASVPEEAVEGLRFTPHPSASLIRSRFPIVSLWGASTGLISSDGVDMSRPEDALTIRPGLEVDTRALPSGGGAFLAALLAGETLAAAAAAGGAADPDFDLSAHLTGLFSAGTFVDVVNDSPAKP